MLARPPELSTQTWTTIERAHAEAEIAFVAKTRRWPELDTAESAVVFFVLDVFEAVVDVAIDRAQAEHWSGEDLRRVSTELLYALIHDAYVEKHSHQTTMDQFKVVLHRELRGCDFWLNLQRAIIAARPTIGQQIDRWRLRCGWSIAKLAAEVELDESSVKDHLADRARPRVENLQSYERVFTEKLEMLITISVE